MNERRTYYGQRPMRPTPGQRPTPSFPDAAQTPLPDYPVVTMAYIPMQTDTTVYDDNKALTEGTLFPVLNKPFAGTGDRR